MHEKVPEPCKIQVLASHLSSHDEAEEEELKADVFDDLTILGYLRPLIEAGRIVVITPPQEYCPMCFVNRLGGKEFQRKVNSVSRWLSGLFLNETQVEFEKKGSDYGLLVSGPEMLVDHGRMVYVSKGLPPLALADKKRIIGRVERGETVKLSRAICERTAKLHKRLADEILRNVFFELACAQSLGTTYLTERQLDIEALNSFSQDPMVASRNQIVQRHLTSLVPFVSSTRIGDLIKLRERESEGFVAFRQALTQTVEEYQRSIDRPFGPDDARQLYGDILEPGLSKLDQTVKSATRRLLKGTAVKIIAWSGAISFGYYAGLIPADLVQAATALGFTNVLAELATPVLGSRFKKDNLASNEMYFLWRVRELSRHTQR